MRYQYKMEELALIVGELVEKYSAGESTSMTYEKAEQLMGAVLYCIHEAQARKQDRVIAAKTRPVQRLYEVGAAAVEKKTKEALKLNNRILPQFVSYGNHCLYDTFVKGIPEFFKWYDIRFHPQDTILTLDYPVLKDLSAMTGIDKIYAFIECIRLEQMFLNQFPQSCVVHVLMHYNEQYQDMVDNLCEPVLLAAVVHVLAGRPLTQQDFAQTDYAVIQERIMQCGREGLHRLIDNIINTFLKSYDADSSELSQYLEGAADNIAVRLQNALEQGESVGFSEANFMK